MRLKKDGKKTRRPSRGVLWLIALLLSSSALVRVGGPVGHAIAGEVMERAGQQDSTQEPSEDTAIEADIARVLAQLQEREGLLKEREAVLATRLQALDVAEAQIEKNLTALIAAEANLAATMALADSAAEDDLQRLTAVYENMKPKEAAPLFEAMDPQFAAGFLGRMRADAAASIMSGLEPQTAYAISVILAGRNANVPTN